MVSRQYFMWEEQQRETLSDRIRPHLAEIASRASAVEDARAVPSENIDIIRKVGFVRSFVPKRYGGDERSLKDYNHAIRLLTKACPSTGWVTGVLNIHQSGVVHYRKELQEEIWKTGPDTIISSSGSPAMKAELVEGGIIVNGKGRWSSGCDHAEWAGVGVKLPDPSDRQFPERRYREHMFMVHKSQYRIEDDWYSKGMRGSGSKALVFDNVFIPQENIEGLDALNLGYARGSGSVDSWIAHVCYSHIFATFLPAIALGCADGMIEEFRKRQRTRKNAYTSAQGILNPMGYIRLAEATHELEAASLYYDHILDTLEQNGRNKAKISEGLFWGVSAKLSYVTNCAVKVINSLFEGSGASAIADFNPMQRYWRDGNTARLHQGMDYDSAKQAHGRYLIGLAPTPDL